MRRLTTIFLAVALSGCATEKQATNLPSGAAAYSLIPAAESGVTPAAADYRLGALDTIDVTVFEEPDLSAKAIQVDASGRIALPLVGSVDAKGKTATELAHELEGLFGAKYLRNPQVTVTVAASVSQKVSVQGEVSQPGIYPLNGPTTLLDVISMAKGETDVARLQEVVVFRTVKGQRMGAVFNVASIRRGEAADPVIEGNDLVVVGYSAAKRFWRDVISAAPLLNVFRPVVTATPVL
jgi:polysaccharide export outer membrane protein